MSVTVTPLLRNALMLDAAASGAAGLLCVAASGPLSALLALPAPLLFWAGAIMLGWAALLLGLSRRETVWRLVMIDVVAGNALWVAASFAILAGGWVQPNALGIAFVVAQALAVALFAALQAAGLRASPAHA